MVTGPPANHTTGGTTGNSRNVILKRLASGSAEAEAEVVSKVKSELSSAEEEEKFWKSFRKNAPSWLWERPEAASTQRPMPLPTMEVMSSITPASPEIKELTGVPILVIPALLLGGINCIFIGKLNILFMYKF